MRPRTLRVFGGFEVCGCDPLGREDCTVVFRDDVATVHADRFDADEIYRPGVATLIGQHAPPPRQPSRQT